MCVCEYEYGYEYESNHCDNELYQLMPPAVTSICQPLPGVTFRIDYECIVTHLSAIKRCDIGINSQLASSYLLYSLCTGAIIVH